MTEETVNLKEYFNKIIELNDRRYTEVNIEKEKALKIKEEADKVALGLARDIQKYKDEKANELREQINKERNLYITHDKLESITKPIVEYVSSQQGRSVGISMGLGYIILILGATGTVLGIVSFFVK